MHGLPGEGPYCGHTLEYMGKKYKKNFVPPTHKEFVHRWCEGCWNQKKILFIPFSQCHSTSCCQLLFNPQIK